MMQKRKKQPRLISPYILSVIVITLIGLVGISAGFFYLSNAVAFATNPNLEPTTVMSQLNPDVTQIPVNVNAITPDNTPTSETFQVLLRDLNATRAEAGLAPLSFNPSLNLAAAEQATYTANTYNLVHEDANGTLVDARVDALGYAWASVGENLASNWTIDGSETFLQWQNSPPHNANMMNPNFTEIGLAYHVTPIGQVYHVMVLARPRA